MQIRIKPVHTCPEQVKLVFFRLSVWSFAGGVDYALDGNWKIGAFGAYAKTDADLGRWPQWLKA